MALSLLFFIISLVSFSIGFLKGKAGFSTPSIFLMGFSLLMEVLPCLGHTVDRCGGQVGGLVGGVGTHENRFWAVLEDEVSFFEKKINWNIKYLIFGKKSIYLY